MPAVASSSLSVAVVILNYQRDDLTRSCLRALSTLETPWHGYLVDAASQPQPLQALSRDFPDLTLIPLADNPGFAAATNRGIARALEDGATHVLLLNNDAQVTPRLLKRLLAVYGIQKSAGIIGPSLRFPLPDGRLQAVGMDVNCYSGRVTLRAHGASPDECYPYPLKVDAISGAAMLVRADVFQKIGLLDEDFYFYFEDIDFCLRARDAGFTSWAVPGAIVYHDGGATMGRAPEQAYYGVRNQLRLIETHALPVQSPLELARKTYVASLHLGQLLRQRHTDLSKALPLWYRGIVDFHQRRFGRLETPDHR